VVLTTLTNLFSIDLNTIEKKFNTLTLDEFVNIPEYKSLVVDTKFLSVKTKLDIIGSFDELDSACGGLLINSENSQALRLVGSSLKNKVSNIFIDPPYNTGDDGFLYKDNFASSSWLSMISERLDLGMGLLADDGAFYASIGDEEQEHLSTLIRHKFGKRRFFANLIWEKKKKGSFLSGNIAKMKDYILAVSKNEQKFNGLVGEIATGTETYPCVNASNPRELRTILPGIASKFKQQDYTLDKGSTISAGKMDLVLHSDLVIEGGFLAEMLIIEGNWRYSQKKMTTYAELNELYITQDLYLRRIVNEPRPKRMKDLLPRLGSGGDDFRAFDLNDLSKFGWGTNEDANDELHQIMGSQYSASYPKPSKLITLLLAASRHEEGVFLDYFAGSGTTGHAVLNLNRADSNNRKYALIEMGQYFNTVLKPRMAKLVYSSNWVNGKPTDVNTGLSHIFKYVELESYEDVLSNIDLKPTNQQEELLGLTDTKQSFSEDYTLKYMLDFESKNQIVNPKLFESPFDAKIKIVRNNQVEDSPLCQTICRV
jgi:adenine-specific DNA-methyltransferase